MAIGADRLRVVFRSGSAGAARKIRSTMMLPATAKSSSDLSGSVAVIKSLGGVIAAARTVISGKPPGKGLSGRRRPVVG